MSQVYISQAAIRLQLFYLKILKSETLICNQVSSVLFETTMRLG